MSNDFLDDLKSNWKEQKNIKTFQVNEIAGMLGYKSKNSLRWLVIITLIEILLGVASFVYFNFFGDWAYENLREIHAERAIIYHQIVVYLGLLFSLIMFGISWHYYKIISPNLPIKKLIKNILNFRKWIHITIFVSLVIGLVLISIYTYQVGFETYFMEFDIINRTPDEIAKAKTFALIFVAIYIVIMLAFFGIYYGIIFGLFLRRLRKNYKELIKLENQ